ncbi:MAG: PadR family transcriptional regulator, partial [Fimbriimonadaceae bacterium]|nr:PadR family transcriptional regulator [Alphaproteobacteria bacterium]
MATALRVSRRKTPNPSNTLDIVIILPYVERTYIELEYDSAEDIRIKTGDLAMNVRTLCLGILNFEEATGYEIKKLSVEGRFSHFIDASFGSIYPALTRLCDEGLVNVRVEQQEGKPARKVYSITDAGRAEFIASLNEAPAPDKIKSEFLFL